MRRLCRLYPAYWVSMLGGVLWWWQTGRPVHWQTFAANATMMPMFLGQEPLVGVYWTLHVELIFYALCLVLHRTHWLTKPATLAVVVVALTGLSRLLRVVDRANAAGPTIGRHMFVLGLAVMVWERSSARCTTRRAGSATACGEAGRSGGWRGRERCCRSCWTRRWAGISWVGR